MKVTAGRAAVVAILILGATGCVPAPSAPTVTVDTGDSVVSVTGPVGTTVAAEAADPASLPTAPADVSYPFGALSVQVSGLAAGGAARVTITLPAPVDSVRKVINGSWDPFIPDATTGATLSADGRTVTLALVDGGRGDADGTANGIIVDPVAPAVTPIVGQCLDSSLDTSEPGAGFSEPGIADLRLTAALNTADNATFFTGIGGTCTGTPIPTRYTVITAADIPSAIARCASLGRNPYSTLFGYGRADWYLCSAP